MGCAPGPPGLPLRLGPSRLRRGASLLGSGPLLLRPRLLGPRLLRLSLLGLGLLGLGPSLQRDQ